MAAEKLWDGSGPEEVRQHDVLTKLRHSVNSNKKVQSFIASCGTMKRT